MLGVPLALGVLLALVGCTATEHCVASKELVCRLLQRMEKSVTPDEVPNPSVLLAMNLAGGDTNGPTYKWLLQEIQEEVVRRAQKDMTSGQVALHVLALLSSCRDPWHVHAQGHSIDLIRVLQQKTDEELAEMEIHGHPKTTLFSMSLDSMALCLAGAGGYQGPAVALAKKVLSPDSHIDVDTRAVAVLAMACAHDRAEEPDERDLLREAIHTVTNAFLDEQEREGMIGNIYSMGLAMQALGATRKFYAPRKWDRAQALDVVTKHDYELAMAIAQVLPALVGRSYLDAASLDCDATAEECPVLGTQRVPRAKRANTANITVYYSITNKLQGQHFHYSTWVTVPVGSTLLKVLEKAEEKDPKTFSFETKQTSWGPMVVSIHGLGANDNDRTYWQFLSSGTPLDQGVGSYKPKDGEHIQAVFSTW